MLQNRIIGYELIPPRLIKDHPLQWKQHPEDQMEYLDDILKKVGIIGVQIVYYSERAARQALAQGDKTIDLNNRTTWPLVRIDGHARSKIVTTEPFPTIITDYDDKEADLLLEVYDTVGWLATANIEQLERLVKANNIQEGPLGAFLERMAELHGLTLSAIEQETLEDFPLFSENITADYICPHCGYQWSGDSLAGLTNDRKMRNIK